ncbi:hypothetical protein QUB63_02215 [Microcoleus sp. ARI1-B5]|uniref:hypothetical protein n=1 Tax=unclassified Microcoleus TaxID=2642155 RepID=UPI002FD17F9B
MANFSLDGGSKLIILGKLDEGNIFIASQAEELVPDLGESPVQLSSGTNINLLDDGALWGRVFEFLGIF